MGKFSSSWSRVGVSETATPPALVMPRAAEVAFLGLQQLADGKAGNVMDMEPVYIRRSEAEVLWEARHGKTAL